MNDTASTPSPSNHPLGRLVEGRRFDARRSVRATLAAAGRPVLLAERRPRLPDYPIMVEELSAADHVAALARALLVRLRGERVGATLYAFSADKVGRDNGRDLSCRRSSAGMAWRISLSTARSLSSSSGDTSATASPLAPARAVRPMRWT